MFHPALTTSASERRKTQRFSYIAGFAARERMREAKPVKARKSGVAPLFRHAAAALPLFFIAPRTRFNAPPFPQAFGPRMRPLAFSETAFSPSRYRKASPQQRCAAALLSPSLAGAVRFPETAPVGSAVLPKSVLALFRPLPPGADRAMRYRACPARRVSRTAPSSGIVRRRRAPFRSAGRSLNRTSDRRTLSMRTAFAAACPQSHTPGGCRTW